MKWLCLLHFFLWLGILCPLSLSAQKSPLHFYHLTAADGLSNNNVMGVCQDHEGFMWFATQGGLNRYDGKHFQVYRHSFYDSTSISSNATSHLVVDRKDNIWVTTSNSVSCLDRQTGHFINYYFRDSKGKIITDNSMFQVLGIVLTADAPLAYSHIYGILQIDRQHQSLVQAHFSGLPYHAKPEDQFLTPDGLIGYRGESAFLISDDDGLHFRDIIKRDRVPAGIPYEGLALLSSDSSNYWMTTKIPDRVLTKFFKVNKVTKKLSPGFTVSPTNIMAFVSYPGNNYLAGFWAGGVAAYDEANNKVQWYSHYEGDPYTLSDGEVQALYRDKNNMIWIATDEGIDYCDPIKDNMQILNNNMKGFGNMNVTGISSLASDSLGNMWVGLGDYDSNTNGLLCFDPKTFKYERFLESKTYGEANVIWGILPESGKNLLLSTQGGLYQFNTVKKELNRSFHHPFPRQVLDTKKLLTVLKKDREGNYWFGLWRKGLIKFNPSTGQQVYFTVKSPDPKLRLNNDLVLAITEDSKQRIWVINGADNVIDCIEKSGRMSHFPLMVNGHPFSDGLKTILADYDDKLWIATRGGLICFNPLNENTKLYSVNDGLLSETVNDLCIDNKNRLWVYTAAGLVWIDTGRAAIHHLDNNMRRFQDYFDDEPMLFANDGHIYMGNRQNLFFFNPDEMLSAERIKPPVLISVHKMDKEVQILPSMGKVYVQPGEDFLSFDFTSLDMMNGRQIHYAYRLSGYSEKWQEVGNEGVAKFTRLPPDNYVLQMRATLQGVPWDKKYTSVAIKVMPAVYQTWWFRTLVLILVGGLLIYIIYYLSTVRLHRRLALLERQHQINMLRNRIAQDIHDDIGSGLTKISIQSELAKHRKEVTAADYLRTIEDINLQSHELVNSLGEIIWTINPLYDTLESMLAYFRYFIHRFLEGLQVRYHIDFQDNHICEAIHPDIKRNLFLILKEALNNVVKHAGADEVNIAFEITGTKYAMRICDNGSGLGEKQANKFGNGISSMQKRASFIKASIEINSGKDRGTSIKVAGHFYTTGQNNINM